MVVIDLLKLINFFAVMFLLVFLTGSHAIFVFVLFCLFVSILAGKKTEINESVH